MATWLIVEPRQGDRHEVWKDRKRYSNDVSMRSARAIVSGGFEPGDKVFVVEAPDDYRVNITRTFKKRLGWRKGHRPT